MSESGTILGWDVGGVNTKAVRLDPGAPGPPPCASVPYELQHDPSALVPTLRRIARDLGADGAVTHAVTMTAELSQAFRTKREGVAFVLDGFATAFPGAELQVFTVGGRFVSPEEARAEPLAAAAANWYATAALVGRGSLDCLLIDVGTTTTDIIPIAGGRPVAVGRTDPERLRSGELVYTGALRTPAEAVAREVPLWDGTAGVAAEGFALMGDAYLWLGRLRPEDYTVPTPDGRPATREFAGERLARVVCGDREMLAERDVDAIARALAAAQVRQVVGGIVRVRERWPALETAVVTGLGDFLAEEGAEAAGLTVRRLADQLGAAARVAPAAAVAAYLLAEAP